MSEIQATDSESPQLTGPGAMLRLAREQIGLTQQQISQKLFLKQDVIEKIESDQFQNNGMSETFVKGYLKMYAKQVGLQQQAVIEAYEALHVETSPPAKLQSFSRKFSREESDNRLMMLTYLIGGVLIALVVLWFVQKDALLALDSASAQMPEAVVGESADQSAQQTEVEQQILANEKLDDSVPEKELLARSATAQPLAPSSSKLDTQARTRSQSIEQASVPRETASLSEVSATTASQNVQTAVSESDSPQRSVGNDSNIQNQQVSNEQPADVEQSQDLVELVFTFSGNCWMKLTDATGQSIAYGVKKAGRVMPVSGVAPFKVTLGAPQSVSLVYNGESVDLSGFRAGKTAKFSLPMEPQE